MPPVTTQTNIPESAGQTADRVENEARALEVQSPNQTRFQRTPVQPTVSANTLANPPQRVTIPQPTVPTQPSQFVNNLDPVIQNSNDGIIRARTQEAEERGSLRNQIKEFGEDTSFGRDTFNDTFRDNFSTDQQRQREDATLRLAQLQGKFRTQAQDISGAKGQSKVFEQAQLGELSREEAVQVGNQALLVQALNGNMESARQIALDTANFANQDRQAELDNLLNQYNALDGIVTGQEKQLVDQAKAKALAEKEELQRTQATTDSAILSGGATVEEMQQLTSTTATNQEKLALSQSILARTARSDRNLDNKIKNMKLAELMSSSVNDGSVISDKDAKAILKDKTAQQTTTLIAADRVLKEYVEMIEEDFSPSPSKRKQLNTFLENVVGPTLAVASGQGAITKEEAEGLADNLGTSLFGRESTAVKAANAARAGYQLKIDTNLSAVDSAYPGASEGFGLFAEYGDARLTEELGSIEDRVSGLNDAQTNRVVQQADALGVSVDDILADNELYTLIITSR